MLAAALNYAARGRYVIPLHTAISGGCSCPDATCDDQGKHPRTRHGLTDATTDAKKITAWWTKWPTANIAIATEPSGLVVLDVDPRHGGNESYERLIAEYGKFDDTEHVLSGGGGSHYYFAAGEQRVKSTSNALGPDYPGLDTRGVGGYIVAPPSLHVSGGRYMLEASSPDVPLPVPEWLVAAAPADAAKPRSTAAKSGNKPPGVESSAKVEGERNTWLASMAGAMRCRDADEGAILAALQALNGAQCSPALSESEVARIAQSYGAYPVDDEWLGDATRGRAFTKVYEDIDTRSDLTGNEIRVLSYIVHDAEMRANPKFGGRGLPMSSDAIGKRRNLAKSTVIAILAKLERLGLIVAIRSNGGKHKTSRYRPATPLPPETVVLSDSMASETVALSDSMAAETVALSDSMASENPSEKTANCPKIERKLSENRTRITRESERYQARRTESEAERDEKQSESAREIAAPEVTTATTSSHHHQNDDDAANAAAEPPPAESSGDERAVLAGELAARGVADDDAAALLDGYEPEDIRRQMLPGRSAAALVQAVRCDWPAPRTVLGHRVQRGARRPAVTVA